MNPVMSKYAIIEHMSKVNCKEAPTEPYLRSGHLILVFQDDNETEIKGSSKNEIDAILAHDHNIQNLFLIEWSIQNPNKCRRLSIQDYCSENKILEKRNKLDKEFCD